MKTGLNLLLWTTHVTEEHFPLFGKLKEIGYDGVEIPIFAHDDAHYARVRKELENSGLECTSVTCITEQSNPLSPDKPVRAEAVSQIKAGIHTSTILGSKLLCGPYHSPVGCRVGRGRTDDEWKWCVEVMQEAAEAAKAAGVTLGIEYLNRFETYFLNTIEDAAKLVKAVGHPNFRTMYDTFHANIEERDVYKAITNHKDVIEHIHISENDRGVPGRGHVHWDESFRAIRAIGYDGWLTIEAFGRALPDLAAATCVWRDLFESWEEVARDGLQFMVRKWRESQP